MPGYEVISKRQHGALLLAVLLMLLCVTVLGMAMLDGAGLELRMVRNMHATQQAFAVADQALASIGQDLAQPDYFPEQSFTDDCVTQCFSNTCMQGLCFFGSDAASRESCLLNGSMHAPYTDSRLWRAGNRHRTLELTASEFSVRYLVEFRCYAANESTEQLIPEDQARLYRITVFADGGVEQSRVMLRGTVRERKMDDVGQATRWLSWQYLPVPFQRSR